MLNAYAKGDSNPAVRDMTIGDALREAAAEAPDSIAIVAGSPDPGVRRDWSYAELMVEAETTARALLERFEPGERVAIWAPNIPEWQILEFGSALAGLILVTVNPAYQPQELAYVLNQSGAAGIFLPEDFRGNPMLKHLESVREECPELREVVLIEQWQDF